MLGGSIGGPIGGAIGGAVGNVIGGAVSASTTAILDGVSHYIAHGTAQLLGSLVTILDRQTSPTLAAHWFRTQYGSMLAVAALLALPLLFAAAISSIVRQDAGPLVRAVFVHLPLAAVGTGVAIQLTTLALAATDELCAMVSANTGANTDALFTSLARSLDGAPGAGGFAVIVVGCIIAFGAFLLTLELVVRSAATYVAMLFLPVALVGLIWPATARWGKRVAEMLVALILSKFVVVAVLSLAVAALRGAVDGQGLSGLFTGASLLILACIAPFALLRMVPVIEAGALAHLDGAGRQIAAAPRQAHQQALDLQKMLSSNGRGPSGEPPVRGDSGLPTVRTEAGGGEAPIPRTAAASGGPAGGAGGVGGPAGGAAEAGGAAAAAPAAAVAAPAVQAAAGVAAGAGAVRAVADRIQTDAGQLPP